MPALLASASFVSGCYEMHGVDPRLDAGPSIGSDAAPRPDTPPAPRDAGPRPDVPSACPLLRADASCLESFQIIAGRPFELPFQYDTCGCCIETSCDVVVDEADRTLRLSTGLCPDECDCDACITPRGSCAVPPIREAAAGQWTVEVNGTDAFRIGVVPSDVSVEPPPHACATYAEPDPCGGRPDFTTGPVRGDVCVEVAEHADRTALAVIDFCATCSDVDAACNVTVFERLTDDLPFGYDIELHAGTYTSSCALACPDVCEVHARECDVPALDPSAYNRVMIDGEVVTTYGPGVARTACAAGP